MGSVVGAIIGKKSSDKAAKAQKQAAKEAAKQFRPFNIDSPIGSVTLTDDGDGFDVGLSDNAAALLERQRSEADVLPEEAMQGVFSRLSALAERGEEDARRNIRQTLFRSGRLGTAGGVREIGEVERALADARLQRELSAFEFGANLRQNAFQNYLALAQAPAANLGPLAINRNPAAAVSAAGMLSAGNTRAAWQNSFGQQLGSAVANTDWGNVFNQAAGGFSQIFAPTPGSSYEAAAFNTVPFDQIGATGIGSGFGGY